jgi:hypothetical protein
LIFKELSRLSKFITDTFDTAKFLTEEIQLDLLTLRKISKIYLNAVE